MPSRFDRGPLCCSRPVQLALLPLMVAASVRLAAEDWPQFLGPRRDATYRGAELAPQWPADGPRRLWQRGVGQGFSGPVVVDDQLILFHRRDGEEVIECMAADSGRTLWEFRYPTSYRDDFGFDEGPRSTPAVADGRVFAFGAEGVAACVELKTGRKLWSVDTRVQFGARKGFFGLAGSPLVEGGRVILQVGGAKGAGIVALETGTGALAWKSGQAEASYASPVAADVRGERWVIALTRDGLVGLHAGSGAVRFEMPFRPSMSASVTAATPLIDGPEVFVSASYGAGAALIDLAAARPATRWTGDDILSNHYATSVRIGGYLYGFDGRQEQGCRLRCVEWKSGKVRWTVERFGAGTVLGVGNDLLVLTERGELVRAPATPDGFRPASRAQLLPFQVRAHPALARGRFYARSPEQLAGFDLRAP